MKNLILSFIAVLCLNIVAYAQIYKPIAPLSFQTKLSQEINTFESPMINIDSLYIQDSIEEAAGDKPWRFGFSIPVNLSLKQQGTSSIIENKGRIWRLRIYSRQALSLNFLYSYYHIPEGAMLHLYNNDRSTLLGAYTNENENPDSTFATAPVKGNSIVLEYFEPFNASFEGDVVISAIIIGYKDLFGQIQDFGNSGACNNNVNCPEGQPWQVEKLAVAMIVTSGGTRLCTGTMINNSRNDGTPYFLTANHCLGGESSWIFMFNYESPNCNNINGPTNQTLQGCQKVASGADSDFALLRLNQKPQDYFSNVYYAGWNRSNIPSPKTVCIHHPRGDIKKISFDNDSCVLAKYLDNQGLPNSHWKILQWDDGTTEGGSSGSPLFDADHRIIGQLHGGWASCTSLTADFFGCFAMSWDRGTTAATRLKDWLDPDNIQPYYLDGLFFGTTTYTNDAQLIDIILPNTPIICSDSISPVIKIRNNGSSPITQLDVYYKVDNNPEQYYNWTGNLVYAARTYIELPPVFASSAQHILSVRIALANDQQTNSDTLSRSFINSSEIFTLNLNTDNKAHETSWKIINSNGVIVHSGKGYANYQSYSIPVCLVAGCYKFVISDSGHDGMFEGTLGNYSFYQDSTLLFSGNGYFGDSVVHNFCVTVTTRSNEISNSFKLFPNPNKGNFEIHFNRIQQKIKIEIADILGQVVHYKEFFYTNNVFINANLPKGIYIAKISSSDISTATKIVVEQ